MRDIKANEKVNISELRNELEELASVCAEETEKSSSEILNDVDHRDAQRFTVWEDSYANEIHQFGHHTHQAIDDFGIEANLEGY